MMSVGSNALFIRECFFFVEYLPINYYNNFHVKVFDVLSWRHVMIATPYLGVAGVMMVQELAWDSV